MLIFNNPVYAHSARMQQELFLKSLQNCQVIYHEL